MFFAIKNFWRTFIMSVLLSVAVVTGHPVILGWNLRPHLRFSTPGYTWETTAGSCSFSPTHGTHTHGAAWGLGKPKLMAKQSREGLPAVYLPHTSSPSVPTHSKWGMFPKATSHCSFVHLCNEFALYFQDCSGKASTPFLHECVKVCVCVWLEGVKSTRGQQNH